jgi:hypothetical protein
MKIKAANGEKPNIPGAMTYTKIIDNHGKKWPFIRGFVHPGPIYHNRTFWNRYETEEKTDIMSQFTKVEIKRKVVTVDLNNDGVITEQEGIESQRLFDVAKANLIHAFENKKDKLKGNEYWRAAGLDAQNKAHQKIASELNEALGIEKTTNGVYKRDYDLVNA